MRVLLSPAPGVGAVGAPVNAGDVRVAHGPAALPSVVAPVHCAHAPLLLLVVVVVAMPAAASDVAPVPPADCICCASALPNSRAASSSPERRRVMPAAARGCRNT